MCCLDIVIQCYVLFITLHPTTYTVATVDAVYFSWKQYGSYGNFMPLSLVWMKTIGILQYWPPVVADKNLESDCTVKSNIWPKSTFYTEYLCIKIKYFLVISNDRRPLGWSSGNVRGQECGVKGYIRIRYVIYIT